MKRGVLGFLALVFGLGVALQAVRIRDVQRGDITSPLRPIGLAAKLPLAPAGWVGRDEPLGNTERLRSAVEQNLNFDDHVNRVFEKQGKVFGAYVGYWSAGRMPVQKVASHTPDRCWSENGWTCTAARFPVVLKLAEQKAESGELRAESGLLQETGRGRAEQNHETHEPHETFRSASQRARSIRSEGTEPGAFSSSLPSEPNAARGEASGARKRTTETQSAESGLDRSPSDLGSAPVQLKPGYWRTFMPPGGESPTYVLYWHLVGDQLYDYGGGFNRRPGWVRWWRDMLHYAIAGSQPQYFIRLTSNRPFDELERDPGFQAVVEALATLGLAAR